MPRRTAVRKTQRGSRITVTPKTTISEKEVEAKEYRYSLQAKSREIIEKLLDNEEFAENLQDQNVTIVSESQYDLTFTSLLKMPEIMKIIDSLGEDAAPMKETLRLFITFSIPSGSDLNQNIDSGDEIESTKFTFDAECEHDVKELIKNETFSKSIISHNAFMDIYSYVTFNFSSTLGQDEIEKCLEGVFDGHKMVDTFRKADEEDKTEEEKEGTVKDDEKLTNEEEKEVEQLFEGDDEEDKTDTDEVSESDSELESDEENDTAKPKEKVTAKPKEKVTAKPVEAVTKEELKPLKVPKVHYADTLKLFEDAAAVIPPIAFPGDVVCVGKDQKRPRYIYIVTKVVTTSSEGRITDILIEAEPIDRLERMTKKGNVKKMDARVIPDYIIAEFGLEKYLELSEKIFQTSNYTKTSLKELKKKLGGKKMLETPSVEEKQYVTEDLIKALETLKL